MTNLPIPLPKCNFIMFAIHKRITFVLYHKYTETGKYLIEGTSRKLNHLPALVVIEFLCDSYHTCLFVDIHAISFF